MPLVLLNLKKKKKIMSLLSVFICCNSIRNDDEHTITQVIYQEHNIVKRAANSSDTTDSTMLSTSTLQPEYTTESTEITEDTTFSTTTPAMTSGPQSQNATNTLPSNTSVITDQHVYYKSMRFLDPDGVYWNDMDGHTRHTLSNEKHLVYSFVTLSFQFPFYGHLIDKFAITPLGFLYMSEFTHPQLDFSYTHYIAPMMANFDTIGNYSHILYKDDGSSFVIEWRDVELNDQEEKGNYTFQTTLFKNGTIMFAYKSVPDTNISGQNWPVKVGLSDAFYYDISTIFGYFRYIFRYHSVTFNVTDLTDNTVVVIHPLPTCNQATTCEECTTRQTGFDCSWCHAVSRCSDGLDWHRQEWLNTNCDDDGVTSSGQCNITSNRPTNNRPSDKPPDSVFTSDDTDSAKSDTTKSKEGSKKTAVIVVCMVAAVVFILVFIIGFIGYARANPNTKSGRWLIEHRPSTWKDRLTSVKYSKDADKVKIKSKYTADELPEVISNA